MVIAVEAIVCVATVIQLSQHQKVHLCQIYASATTYPFLPNCIRPRLNGSESESFSRVCLLSFMQKNWFVMLSRYNRRSVNAQLTKHFH